MKKIRCAIYTRKSSEEGLEQEFNSLDAQRESCAAYIISQKHEGWELLPDEYNDGGFSGGNMDRPALKQLMEGIEDGKIDIIVVYKVDRLTRSLTDFSRLVDVMDKKGVSFVSITQQFNTTTSMGRLTLNVLLSFAQFEREVTGERIRDKIALSKQKGKWMGGVPPLGYDSKDRKIVINKSEAKTVRHMFDRYLELKSVHLLKAEFDADGIVTKKRIFKNGKTSGGLSFCRTNLNRLLQNRIYIGEIVHKDKSYPGEHEAIIPIDVFEKVQAVIASNRRKEFGKTGTKSPCLLTGLLFDDRGNHMSPKHSRTRKLHYRYYTSQAIIQGYSHKAGSLPNIPAYEIEQLVKSEILAFLKHGEALQYHLQSEELTQQKKLMHTAQHLKFDDIDKERAFIRSVVHRIELSDSKVQIYLCADRLIQALQGNMAEGKAEKPERQIHLTREIKLAATNNGSKVIIGDVASNKNMQLIKAIARSFLWNEQLISGEKVTITEIAEENNINSATYVSRVMRLCFLAPDIIEMIIEGSHPVQWTVEKLFAVRTYDWQEQRQILGLI
ncbi:MAG: recombinase family protein [Proteobacteria bacterium]|nr:recombinase family protein [Pseudomonadota bacterium]MDA0967371.1 recombinase family protein [Pseudomonadota bacterium]